MNLSTKTRKILKGESPIPLYFFALMPFSLVYSLAVRIRAALYRIGVFNARALPCKVISVGNLTAGGTGKTPMVIYLARLLASKGMKLAVLTRGYGGSREGRTEVVSDGKNVILSPAEAGDEAILLARSLPGVPVVMGGKRYEAGILAVERFNPEAVILDDAYQHLSLKRDINILLLDAVHPFGNGFTLPMGYLREPVCAAGRADIAVLTRTEIKAGTGSISKAAPLLPVIKAAHRASSLRGLWGGEDIGLGSLAGARVLQVSGLADPASFSLILQKFSAKITKSLEYPDHHAYSQDDLAEIQAATSETGAEMVVTTEKDAVKLSTLKPVGVKVAVLGIEMEISEGADALDGLLFRHLGKN